MSTSAATDLQARFDSIIKRQEDGLSSVLSELTLVFKGITLIVDEANIALTITGSTTPAEIKATKDALAVFTRLTKQLNKLNVILVSSEHTFPFRLRNNKVSFRIEDFTNFIYAGEISPKDMYDLLTTVWGFEHSLAVSFIDHYGGHVWDMYRALISLSQRREKFRALDSRMSNNVIKCLKWKGDKDSDNQNMREVLRQLAVAGFAPIEEVDDPIAKVISENNVGGVVSLSSLVIGLRDEAWQSTKFKNGLIPAKQSMRLAIAELL
eukprot:gene30612-39882_t